MRIPDKLLQGLVLKILSGIELAIAVTSLNLEAVPIETYAYVSGVRNMMIGV